MITEQNIRCFIIVAQELSISKASERLYMSRQAVSVQIRMLEKSLGAQLFNRLPNKLTLTPIGECYLSLFSEFINKLYITQQRYGKLSLGTMPVRIGVMRTLEPWEKIPDIIDYCQNEGGMKPDVCINIYEPTELTKGLRDSSLDIAFTMPIDLLADSKDFEHILYAYIPQVLLIQKGHPLSVKFGKQEDAVDRILEGLPLASWSTESMYQDPQKGLVSNWKQAGHTIYKIKQYINADSAVVGVKLGECVIIAPSTNPWMYDPKVENYSMSKELDYYCIWKKQFSNPCVELFVNKMLQIYESTVKPLYINRTDVTGY